MVSKSIADKTPHFLFKHVHFVLLEYSAHTLFTSLTICGTTLTSHNTEVTFGLEGVEHLDYIFVTELPQNFNFLPQILNVLLTLPMFHYELHRRDLASTSTATFVHLRNEDLSTRTTQVLLIYLIHFMRIPGDLQY